MDIYQNPDRIHVGGLYWIDLQINPITKATLAVEVIDVKGDEADCVLLASDRTTFWVKCECLCVKNENFKSYSIRNKSHQRSQPYADF